MAGLAVGAKIVGGVVSFTVTLNEQVVLFPAASVAVEITSVVPIENVLPAAGTLVRSVTLQLSVATGGLNVTIP
jgi:hypothetical protein